LTYGVTIVFTVRGRHYWPNAPVVALKEPHEHIFRIRVSLEEKFSREIEFLTFRDWCYRLLCREENSITDFETESCEDIAKRLATRLKDVYGERRVQVCVWEDDTVGGWYVEDNR